MSRLLDTTLVCPACTAKFKLAEGTRNADVIEIARLAALFGSDWSVVESYLSCFRTAQGKGIRPEKLRVILEELVDIWQRKAFGYEKKHYNVDPALLRSMLRSIGQRCDELAGFTNHNYLKAALAREIPKHNAQAAAAERRDIQRDKSGAVRQDEPGPSPETVALIHQTIEGMEARLTPEEKAASQRKRRSEGPIRKPEDYDQKREALIAEARANGVSDIEIARLFPGN